MPNERGRDKGQKGQPGRKTGLSEQISVCTTCTTEEERRKREKETDVKTEKCVATSRGRKGMDTFARACSLITAKSQCRRRVA